MKEEKNKNKILEERINSLKNELDKIKKNSNYNLNEIDSKESLYKIILEKDKEIWVLKSKLSRFPFELKEGERMISIIFTSLNPRIYHSIICKNTDRFNLIENIFYNEYSEFSESENYFIVNGKKINKTKTLEENKIKNNDIIILNQIE